MRTNGYFVALMGFTLPNLTTPIVKVRNCILLTHITLIPKIGKSNIEKACIPFSFCPQSFPANLLA
ncbi:MAG: hypothetical protein ACTS7E_01595 [Arsenophonus sp. NC-CH8-MAG3]